jgi:hypothetical protein
MGIFIKNLDEFKEDYGLVMDFSHDNIMSSITQKNWKNCAFKKRSKYCQNKNKASSNEEFKVKCIETFIVSYFNF